MRRVICGHQARLLNVSCESAWVSHRAGDTHEGNTWVWFIHWFWKIHFKLLFKFKAKAHLHKEKKHQLSSWLQSPLVKVPLMSMGRENLIFYIHMQTSFPVKALVCADWSCLPSTTECGGLHLFCSQSMEHTLTSWYLSPDPVGLARAWELCSHALWWPHDSTHKPG